jgi:hypothetical protein
VIALQAVGVPEHAANVQPAFVQYVCEAVIIEHVLFPVHVVPFEPVQP